ncbi:MAG: RNA 2',3'-cyclic phosphodiesterase [Candidatus Omnitrophica bacterium]|nr:RNA 2',3'-cyclic phosphodiesterase [Candidatus Omnitrophota bacterium]
MRTFIAIELPKEIKLELAKLQEYLKQSGADVKWVAPENIHLTLKFLGERDDKKIKEIELIAEEIAKNHAGFEISLSSLGTFPGTNYPRVVWIGITQGAEQTEKIAAELEERIAKIGIPKEERGFSAHITIGRVKSNLNKEKLIQELSSTQLMAGKNLKFKAGQITLFKSTLTPRGPIYEILKTANLTNS